MAVNTEKEQKMLRDLEKLQRKQVEANNRLQKEYTQKNDKLYAVLSVAVDKMEAKLTNSLVKGNKAVVKDYISGTTKNIEHAFGKQSEQVNNVLKKHEDILDKTKDDFVELEKEKSKNWQESMGFFRGTVGDVFNEVTGTFKGMFGDVFGPIYDNLAAPLIGIGKSLFEFGKATFTLVWTGLRTVAHLKWLKDFFKDQRKRELRGEVGKDNGGLKAWLLRFLGIGSIGAGIIMTTLGTMITQGVFGWLEGVDWTEKAINAGVGILKLPFKILELIENGILRMMGKTERVDFGEEFLTEKFKQVNDWVWNNFTEPLYNFVQKIKGWLKSLKDKVVSFFSIPDQLINPRAGVGSIEIPLRPDVKPKAIMRNPRGETGGPVSSTPNVRVSSSMSILTSIRNVLVSGLGRIIHILSGNKTGLGIPSDFVGAGTFLSDVPGGTGQWVDPLGSDKRITSQFGMRRHPVTGEMIGHKGIDMAGPYPGMFGHAVMAARDGIVSIARRLTGYGNVVYVDHDNGYQTRYAHLQNFGVNEGQMISAGTKIGGMGNTGVGTGPHLHYEIRKNGNAINPMDILSARDGAMISSQASEFGIPADIHPNEAILPLTDKVLGSLGEKMGKHIDLTSDTLSGYGSYMTRNKQRQMQNQMLSNKRLSDSISNYMKEVKNSLKDNNGLGERLNMIVNSNNTGQSRQSDNIPDQIENALLVLTNTSWGIA